jgi:hypothetical protein
LNLESVPFTVSPSTSALSHKKARIRR